MKFTHLIYNLAVKRVVPFPWCGAGHYFIVISVSNLVTFYICALTFQQEEDYGTEYLVQPIGKPEDEDGGSDFEPVEDGAEDEDIDEDEDDDNYVAGNPAVNQKRSRDVIDSDSEDEERNHKRR